MSASPDFRGISRGSRLKVGAAGATGMLAAALRRVVRAAARAADPAAATIDVNTSTAIPIQPGLIGYNLHITNLTYSFTDDEYRALVAQLQHRK